MQGWTLALRLVGIGWYVAVCVVLGVLGGLWLDRKLGTTPLFILLGTLTGTIVAFYGMYRLVLPLMDGKTQEGDTKD